MNIVLKWSFCSVELEKRLINEQQTDEQRELACHTSNLKAEVVKGIIQGSELNPKLAKHAQCVGLHCFKSQSFVSNYNSLKEPKKCHQHDGML